MSQQVEEEIEALTRGLLAERLTHLSAQQRCMFHDRIYPHGVEKNKLVSAIDLCDRTIRKNITTPSRMEIGT